MMADHTELSDDDLTAMAVGCLQTADDTPNQDAIASYSLQSIAASLILLTRYMKPEDVMVSTKLPTPAELDRMMKVREQAEIIKPLVQPLSVEQAAIESETRRRVEQEYARFWVPARERYEIDLGTKAEWIATKDELYDDVRKAVMDDMGVPYA
jgi:hypothetical protein